jgi:putative ABC transport system substrate-binding protein
MDRRTFLATIAGGLLAAPLGVEAEQAGKVYRIGFLSDSRQVWDEAFRQGLRDMGYVAGQSITIEYRYSEGHLERLSPAWQPS